MTWTEIVAAYRGHRGDTESESNVLDANSNGTIEVFSDNRQAALIAARARGGILNAYEPNGPGKGVCMTIDRAAFRGFGFCFRDPARVKRTATGAAASRTTTAAVPEESASIPGGSPEAAGTVPEATR
jgi:hypothetical protein